MIDGTTSDDLLTLPLDRFCNRIVEWVRTRMTEQKFEAWMMSVDAPPVGVLGEVDEEAEMAAFRAVMAGLA